jgi:uncharacterized protein
MKFLLPLEYLLIYFLIPFLITTGIFPRAPLFYLWITGLIAYIVLRKKYQYCFKLDLNFAALKKRSLWIQILLRNIACALFCYLWLSFTDADKLFTLPLHRPLLWIMIVFLYPILSVLPQEIIYRSFFFRRYRAIFPSTILMIAGSGVAFGYVHIIFHTVLSVFLSTIGGYLLSDTYKKTNSLAAVCVEHSLYGLIIFTVGLGSAFYAPEFR